MNKSLSIKLSILAALVLAVMLSLGAFFGLNYASADRSVTVTGSSIFVTSGGADVWAHEQTVKGENDEDVKEYYVMFVLDNADEAVTYKKNLAYNWFYNAGELPEEGAPESLEKAEGWFNMEIGFETLDFERYIVTFESQQYSQTKDGKTTNYIVFVPAGTGVKVLVCDELPEKDDDTAFDNAVEVASDRIKIEFTAQERGEYKVSVNNEDKDKAGNDLAFKNVGGYYSKYSSSTTTPVNPLAFTAEFAENADSKSARMVMYNLNGQSFKYNSASESGSHFSGTYVNDVTAPVLCLDKGVSFIEEGEEITFNYTVIDVLASSPSLTTSYFMLDKSQVAQGESFNASNCSDEKLFTTVKADEDQYMIPHVSHYVPVSDNYNTSVFDEENFKVTAAVKVYLKLTDTTATGGQSAYVLLDWYVDGKYLIDVNDNDYIAVATDKIGAAYAYTDGSDKLPSENDSWKQLLEDYRSKVAEAAQDLKAGSKNYFYLPSVESLISDNSTGYSDLSYNIYYNNGSQQSATGKSASNLSINITKAGEYVFTVYATDAAGNPMYYFDENGAKQEIKTSDIWTMYKDEDNEGLTQYLPWFRFSVGASEITIEDPGEQDTAYVDTKYTSISFEINGVSYDTTYKLYRFENNAYYEENNVALTYDEFMKVKEQLFVNNRNLFTEIYAKNDMQEDDEEYELYGAYEWDNSALSFIPQDENAFYLVTCTATSSENGQQKDVAYMGISASPKVRALKGEDTWLQDNMTSVILLCIAGVSLIGIILLIFIKPKNKDVDEAELDLKAEKKTKKNKK